MAISQSAAVEPEEQSSSESLALQMLQEHKLHNDASYNLYYLHLPSADAYNGSKVERHHIIQSLHPGWRVIQHKWRDKHDFLRDTKFHVYMPWIHLVWRFIQNQQQGNINLDGYFYHNHYMLSHEPLETFPELVMYGLPNQSCYPRPENAKSINSLLGRGKNFLNLASNEDVTPYYQTFLYNMAVKQLGKKFDVDEFESDYCNSNKYALHYWSKLTPKGVQNIPLCGKGQLRSDLQDVFGVYSFSEKNVKIYSHPENAL